MEILNNNCFEYEDWAICGTRGWFFEEERSGAHDEKVFKREMMRLEASLKAAGEKRKMVFLHYPPRYKGYECKEILELLEKIAPVELAEEWDNDGLMCSADTSAEVRRVLCTLDVTEEIVDYAIEQCFDLIVSHHPLIFRPITSITEDNPTARKVIKLIESGVSVFSFHTRADKVSGGVNDSLCDLLGMFDTRAFGEGELGRIGELDEDMGLEDFAYKIKETIGADAVRYADGYNTVRRVAVVGGDGKSYISAAIKEGADTFISGRIGYNVMEEASERGINLIEAGHYFTEQPVTEFFRSIILGADSGIDVEIAASNNITTI